LDEGALAKLVTAQLHKLGHTQSTPASVQPLCGLFKDRCTTTVDLARWLSMYFAPVAQSAEDLATHVTEAIRPAVRGLASKLSNTPWNKAAIAAAIKETLSEYSVKMPQLAPAVRVLLCGRAQTPSVDAVLELFTQEVAVARLRAA
jgi:glutamyl-tRNA synthetase